MSYEKIYLVTTLLLNSNSGTRLKIELGNCQNLFLHNADTLLYCTGHFGNLIQPLPQLVIIVSLSLTMTQFFPMWTKDPTWAALTTQSSSMIT